MGVATFCGNCGNAATAEDRYCRNCGRALSPLPDVTSDQPHEYTGPDTDVAEKQIDRSNGDPKRTRLAVARIVLGSACVGLAIVGTVVGVLVFAIGSSGTSKTSKENACRTEGQTFQTAMDAYYAHHGVYADSSTQGNDWYSKVALTLAGDGVLSNPHLTYDAFDAIALHVGREWSYSKGHTLDIRFCAFPSP